MTPFGLSKLLLLLAISVAGALEMYDEATQLEKGEAATLLHNNIETDLYDPEASDEDVDREALLYQLLATPRLGKLHSFPYRSRFINADTKGPLSYPKSLGLDFLQKRSLPKNMGRKITTTPRPQPPRKNKKVSKGFLICYFKLCNLHRIYD